MTATATHGAGRARPSGTSGAVRLRRRPGPGHEPALDGLRGLAVGAVLLFHGGFSWARGGYLGVSLFFTLSGFLIARLLLAEHDRRGRVDLRRFWGRRVRRLWPASLATLAFVIVLARLAFTGEEVAGLRGDLLASLAQVVNWRFILEGRSYGDLFASPSLVQHFWSLAIEEQMYLVVPLVLVAALRLRHRAAVAAVVGGLMLTSVLATVLVQGPTDADRIYYGTDTRAFELLAGVMLAVLAREAPRLARPRGVPVQVLGALAAVLSLVAWATVAQDTPLLTEGGLWLYALVSVALILGSRAPGPLNRGLSWRPLVGLGRISYGVYLIHWPIFLWLSPERLGVGEVAAFVIGVAVTISLALLSHQLLEQPVRGGQARWLGTGARPSLIAGAAFAVVLVAIPTVAPQGSVGIDFAAGQDTIDEIAGQGGTGGPRVAFYGDSTALAAALGMATWSREGGEGQITFEDGWTGIGCGLVTSGKIEYMGKVSPIPSRCADRGAEIAETVDDIDLAILMAGAWEAAAIQLPGREEFQTIEDPELHARYEQELEGLHDLLTSGGATMAFVLIPDLEAGVRGGRSPAEPFPESDPERVELYNDMGRRLAEEHDDVVLIDLRGWMAAQDGGMLDRDLRADGIHLSTETATTVAGAFLGPAAIAAAER